MSDGRGPIDVHFGDFHVSVLHGLPPLFDTYCERAAVVHLSNLSSDEGDAFFVGVGRRASWPELIIASRYQPCGYGFDPGIALVADRGTLFVGAGEEVQCWRLGDEIERLWADHAEFGFWRWDVVGDTVIMSAELELAAWDAAGTKLWTTFVEPPWDYHLADKDLDLDVMGHKATFPIRTGPTWIAPPWR